MNMEIKEKNIFLVGIKGVAMTNLAIILKKMGKNITGSDVGEEFITEEILKRYKISYKIGFCKKDLPKNIQLLIYSAAHQGKNNPQVKFALEKGIKVCHQAEFLGKLTNDFEKLIAVCGCHGKTTTSSLLAFLLRKLEKKIGYLVGTSSFAGLEGGGFFGKKFFVIEADEYGVNPPWDRTPKFFFLRPQFIICNNIDFDHPDVYSNLDEVKKAFLLFFDKRKLFLCIDDPVISQVLPEISSKNRVTFGFLPKADFWIKKFFFTEKFSLFEPIFKDRSLGIFKTSLFGKKNLSNSLGVIAFLFTQGYSLEKIRKQLPNFTGLKRRFELLAFHKNIYLFDDYGHHPAEIKATIEAARLRFPKRRIILIFQPHTFSRTKKFLKDFAESLSLANFAFVIDIFPSAREKAEDFLISSKDIQKEAEKSKKLNVVYCKKKEIKKNLKEILKEGDVIFTMGAGDVYKLKDDIMEVIKKL